MRFGAESGIARGTVGPGAVLFSRALCATAAALSFSAAVVAGALVVGALAAGTAGLALQTWQETGRVSTPAAWRDARDRLWLARRLDPFSADHSADLGHLYAWQAWQHPVSGREARAYRLEALRHYREAVAKRPTWGFGWAHVAEQHLLLGAMDDVGFDALEKAARFAPWEGRVQHKVVWMGLGLWDDVPTGTRGTVLGALERAVRVDNGVAGLIRLAHGHERLDLIAPLLRTPEHRALLDYLTAKLENR